MATYRFGEFTLDTDAYEVRVDDEPLALTGKPLDLLVYLAAKQGRLVTRDDLFRDLWPDTTVSDNVLTQAVSEVRRALDDAVDAPRFIETISRRGYRFIAKVEVSGGAAPRSPETSSLDVLRSVFDGQLKLESLDAAGVDEAITQFTRAIQLDSAYAAGYVGLANARFWKYESTRSRFRPDAALLASAINDARQAVLLAPSLDETHATLSYLLAAAARWDEARAEAERALALRPEFWAHHFRLGNASWGGDAIRALTRSLELYPAFAWAHFELAIVHVARRALDVARAVLQEGIAIQARPGAGEHRFPANGLHWLLGMIALSQGDVAAALAEADSEIALGGRCLYAREFTAAALNLRGFAYVVARDAAHASAAFHESLECEDEQVRSHVGLAQAARLCGQDPGPAIAAARRGVEQLQSGGRLLEAVTMSAALDVVGTRPDAALAALAGLLAEPAPWAGWSLAIDPLFAALRPSPAFEQLAALVAERAGVARQLA